MNFKIQTKKRVYSLSLSVRARGEKMLGYTNRTVDGLYIISLDYDDMEFDLVVEDIKRLQEDYELSDFYIFETNKGYHAVCLDKVTMYEFIDIAKSSSCDPGWREIPIESGKRLWTLRLSDKNEHQVHFAGKVKSLNEGYETQSLAHAKLLNSWFNLRIKLNNPDGNKEVKFSSYPLQTL